MSTNVATTTLRPRYGRTLGLTCVAVLAASVWSACSSSDGFEYDEDRGLFAADELRDAFAAELDEDDVVRAQELLERGKEQRARGNYEEALLYFSQLAQRYPQFVQALQARIETVTLLVELGEHMRAHEEMTVVVHFYKEFLQQTRNQHKWEQLRDIWYADIGLGLFFADEERTQLGDLSAAIKVFERILAEEIRGRYAALCLLRIGDAHMNRGDFAKAREMYLHVVEAYPDFQQYQEHEQALFKAAEATMGLMKGAEYNLERLDSTGSETHEKGALNLLNDYIDAYEHGHYIADVQRLKSEIHDVLVWRDFNAARVYDRMGRREAARAQYWMVTQRWGNPGRYPDQQVYVQRAERRLEEIGAPAFVEESQAR